jgi:transposase InsO family protein
VLARSWRRAASQPTNAMPKGRPPQRRAGATRHARTRSCRRQAQRIGLARYMLIRDAADVSLSPRQRGAKVREFAAREHTDLFGRAVRVSRWTLDYGIRQWRRGGYEALVPSVRQAQPRTPDELLAVARALKRDNRTALPARCAGSWPRSTVGPRTSAPCSDCYDNSMMESFSATLQLVNANFEWIECWYNPNRRHSSIGMHSSIEFGHLHTPSDRDR